MYIKHFYVTLLCRDVLVSCYFCHNAAVWELCLQSFHLTLHELLSITAYDTWTKIVSMTKPQPVSSIEADAIVTFYAPAMCWTWCDSVNVHEKHIYWNSSAMHLWLLSLYCCLRNLCTVLQIKHCINNCQYGHTSYRIYSINSTYLHLWGA